jgi:hypothetical protein
LDPGFAYCYDEPDCRDLAQRRSDRWLDLDSIDDSVEGLQIEVGNDLSGKKQYPPSLLVWNAFRRCFVQAFLVDHRSVLEQFQAAEWVEQAL